MSDFQNDVWRKRDPFDRRNPEPGSRVAVALERIAKEPAEGLLCDLGCGDGSLLMRLQGECLGIDVSRVALERVPQQIPRIAADLDAPRLPLRDSSIGACTLLDALPYVESPRALLSEIARVLAPGGRLLVSVPNGRQVTRLWDLLCGRAILFSDEAQPFAGGQRYIFAGPSLRSLIQETGFDCVEIIGLLPAPGGSRMRRIAGALTRRGVGRAWLAPGLLAIGRKR
jgi:SAM-dependent methyltransferase